MALKTNPQEELNQDDEELSDKGSSRVALVAGLAYTTL